MDVERCPGCGVELPAFAGPVHRYMESSPSCWVAYGEVLARECSDPALMAAHRLTVDAYAVQHPGRPSPQSIQSVALHLISLCVVLFEEMGFDDVETFQTLTSRMWKPWRWFRLSKQRSTVRISPYD